MLIYQKLDKEFSIYMPSAFFLAILLSGIYCYLFAEKGIIYDPEKGIIFTDDSHAQSTPSAPAALKKTLEKKVSSPSSIQQSSALKSTAKKEDLHINRKKDPPEIYYKSGLEYFKNEDFSNALKNFTYADSLSDQPLYKLWKAKTLRRMNQFSAMLSLLNKIATQSDSSDVADDALLEMAVYYKSINSYEKSLQTLTQLIEQYPFGVSCATGEELPSIARNQRRLIRQEMINSLAILGYQKEDLTTAYRQFQKENNLKITGTGTIETVSLIKRLNENLLKNQEEEIEKSGQLQKYQWLMLFSLFILFGTICSLVILRINIAFRKKQLLELNHTLIELDTGKI
jgi:tetratricopeptide (TPR) repeat protein